MRPLQHPRGNQNWFIGSYGSGIIDFFLFSNTFYSIILVLSVYAKLICIILLNDTARNDKIVLYLGQKQPI